LKANYVDIPLYPSVINFNTILTQNVAGDALARFLVGKVSDPRFGSITATTYLNFSPPLAAVAPDASATADSIVMELAMDFYAYGSRGSPNQTFEVHELLDTLNGLGYYSSNTVPYSSTTIATGSIAIDPETFANILIAKADADTSNDARLKIQIKLPNSLAQSLMQDMIDNSTTLADFNVFSGKYKGFALVPKNCDKIFGMDPTITIPMTAANRAMVLYYSSGGVQNHFDFPNIPRREQPVTGLVNNVVSFTNFSEDRTGSPLDGIQPYTDFKPSNGYAYVQAGAGLATKLDFRDFYKYVDTLNNVIINSAELITNNSITQGLCKQHSASTA